MSGKAHWLNPFSTWTRDQLDSGLIDCFEFSWHNVARGILNEICIREDRSIALYGAETYWTWLGKTMANHDFYEFERGKITYKMKTAGHSNSPMFEIL